MENRDFSKIRPYALIQIDTSNNDHNPFFEENGISVPIWMNLIRQMKRRLNKD